jgi:hypothetical protein
VQRAHSAAEAGGRPSVAKVGAAPGPRVPAVPADAGAAAAADRERLQRAVCGLASRWPELSAATGLPGWQKGALAGLAATLGGGAVLAPEPTLVALLAVMAVPFLLVVALRAVSLWHLLAGRRRRAMRTRL